MEKDIQNYYGWIQEIEGIIKLLTFENDQVGRRTYIGWIYTLITMVVNRKDTPKGYDGNMHLAFQAGLILLGWCIRTWVSKIYDSRRPVKDRKESLAGLKKALTLVDYFMTFSPNKLPVANLRPPYYL